MSFTVAESYWVTLRKGDPSFQLQGPFTIANRASILLNRDCPTQVADYITWAESNGWIEAVATVPKTDPTYMWEILKR